MRLLILLTNNPTESILVKLHTEELTKEVKELINKRRLSSAISVALTKGNFEKTVRRHDLGNVDADLILTEDRVMWDLKR